MNDLQVRPERDSAPAAPVVKARKKSLFREYSEAIIIAVLLALFIRQFAVQAFTIPSGSMMDTLLIGDYILVNKFLYGPELPFTDLHVPGLREPQRGDIIVFKYPQDEKRDFIKRIIGVPGDQILIRGHDVHVNGQRLREPYVKHTAPNPGHTGPTYCGYAYGCELTAVPPDLAWGVEPLRLGLQPQAEQRRRALLERQLKLLIAHVS